MGSNNMEMAFKMRSTKFRHVYGRPFRKEHCFENVRITRNAHDSHFCAVNPKYLAVVTESAGGGSFIVIPIERTGRVDINSPKVCGHSGAVMDIKWNPFNDQIIASCSDDSTIKIWQIPQEGLYSNLSDWSVDLHGHQRKVGYMEWHPTADNVLLTAGFDFKCIVWNVEQAEPVNIIDCHNDTIFSMYWNNDGSLFCTTSKDKRIRVIDPRQGQIAIETEGHPGSKASKSVFLKDNQRIFTTGFSRMSERQYALWDVRNMNSPIVMNVIDYDSGTLLPYYDPDLNIVYIAGKGNGNIRYYEVASEEPYVHYLNAYQSSSPQRGLGMMPKRGCDVTTCEVLRFYKLHAGKNLIEPISMICPRKSDKFQEDIYPPTRGTIPSLGSDEWVSGQNRDPILVSVAEGALTLAPTITTYKAVNKQNRENNRAPPQRANTIATDTITNNNHDEPASLRNIKRLSTNEDIVSISETVTADFSERKAIFENRPQSPAESPSANRVEKRVWSPTSPVYKDPSSNGIAASDSDKELSPIMSSTAVFRPSYATTDTGPESPRKRRPNSEIITSGFTNANLAKLVLGTPTNQPTHKIHVRKMWQQPQTIFQHGEEHSSVPNTDAELKKAYFRQQDEIRQLQEQIALKDKRIRQLEEEVRGARQTSCGPGESNC